MQSRCHHAHSQRGKKDIVAIPAPGKPPKIKTKLTSSNSVTLLSGYEEPRHQITMSNTPDPGNDMFVRQFYEGQCLEGRRRREIRNLPTGSRALNSLTKYSSVRPSLNRLPLTGSQSRVTRGRFTHKEIFPEPLLERTKKVRRLELEVRCPG